MSKRMRKLPVFLAVASLAMFAISYSQAHATEVVTNGGLEAGAGPLGWTLTQSVTGMPGAPLSAVEQVGLADIQFQPAPGPGGLGLFLKTFAGNEGPYLDQNQMINVSMSQTVPVPANKNFTFTGHSFFQTAASNNLDTLFADSPSGAVASPTQTTFTVEFLNGSNAVLDTQTIVLPKNRATDVNPDDWQTHTIPSLDSPAGTTQARITAAATNMVASCTTECMAGHDVYLDNFSLVQNGLFGGEKLSNGNLNMLGAPADWTVDKTAEDNLSFNGAPSFAAHTGNVGMWLRSFAGGDAKILQTVPGTAGGDYTFSGWSKWESGYNGADPFSTTQTFMTMEFLDAADAVIGSPVSLDLRTVQINDGTWREFSLPTTTAPDGTVSVRISAGATGMANSTIDPQSAFFDDFSLTALIAGVPGDYNNNGIVDTGDYVVWRKYNGTAFQLQNEVSGVTPGQVTQEDYNAWRTRFGKTSAGSGSVLGNATAVPEPTACCLALLALAGWLGIGLRRRGL